jgi:hypothetical protein
MHRKTRRFALAVVVIGALVAGGAAYTNSITGAGTTNNTAGYADVTVSGATLVDASYGLSADGSEINTVTFTFSGNLSNDNLEFLLDTAPAPGGGNGNALAACTGTNVTSGVIQSGAYNSGTGKTVVTCTGLTVATGGATDLDVAVTNT